MSDLFQVWSKSCVPCVGYDVHSITAEFILSQKFIIHTVHSPVLRARQTSAYLEIASEYLLERQKSKTDKEISKRKKKRVAHSVQNMFSGLNNGDRDFLATQFRILDSEAL